MPFSLEIESTVAASRMFKAALIDWYNLGPKLVPEILLSGSIVEGESGAVGGVRQLNFSSVMPFSYVKERLDFIDHEKFEVKVSAVEGGHLGTILESASEHFQIKPTASGGCVVKVVTESKLKPGAVSGDDEAKAKEAMVMLFKAAEAYLVANPDAYA
uniref:Intracellular pathogenesis-related protein PR-103 n=1 Tax=Lilium longiflorum TaxID=4690 RepID=Q9SEY9_LILLO|nr:intracellular pathogenesis-related protein PR-103 [Lilium longiflorum]